MRRFLEALHALAKLPEGAEAQAKAKAIFAAHVAPGATYEVNVSGETAQPVRTAGSECFGCVVA